MEFLQVEHGCTVMYIYMIYLTIALPSSDSELGNVAMQRWRDPTRQLCCRMVCPCPTSPLLFFCLDARGIAVCRLSNWRKAGLQSSFDKDVPLATASWAAELTVWLLAGSWSYFPHGGEESIKSPGLSSRVFSC